MGGQDKIDHEVVIKYVPFVQDSKRALDEYSSSIFMNGINTISSYNVCEDSLLATPLMIDMIVLGELMTRMKINEEYIINSFTRQRQTLVNLLKVAPGIQVDDATLL